MVSQVPPLCARDFGLGHCRRHAEHCVEVDHLCPPHLSTASTVPIEKCAYSRLTTFVPPAKTTTLRLGRTHNGHVIRWRAMAVGGTKLAAFQALIGVRSLWLLISMRRGLAFSATGIARRNTPSW